MNKSVYPLALAACVALPVWAADPVAKESGSKAKEQQAAKEQALAVRPVTTGRAKGPPPVRPAPMGAPVEPSASK